MSAESQRTCPSCGNEFSGVMEFCPVCLLRRALPGAAESGASSFEETVTPTPEQATQRFEHYELVIGEDGRPVELGRGAMGVTYKALDINLRCPVTLKVISERYVGDEAARLRFLREARAAASVRHPNVASVFHLGRARSGYFYAMEFVEGETLDRLIKRSGRLDLKLALEIATQVAAGLAAVHEQNLVHRDIKPTNIMVRLKEGCAVTAKIIDLGLAKTVDESASEAGISIPGAFAGTPEFASPEQFAGVGVDIRSDLYSLGVVLWEMLTGHVVFRGSPAEVMHHHQHSPLPLEQLEGVPKSSAGFWKRRAGSFSRSTSSQGCYRRRASPHEDGPRFRFLDRRRPKGAALGGVPVPQEDFALLFRFQRNKPTRPISNYANSLPRSEKADAIGLLRTRRLADLCRISPVTPASPSKGARFRIDERTA
jgi:serine/threonine protein kinase